MKYKKKDILKDKKKKKIRKKLKEKKSPSNSMSQETNPPWIFQGKAEDPTSVSMIYFQFGPCNLQMGLCSVIQEARGTHITLARC